MEITWQHLAYLFEGMFILVVFWNFREAIQEKLNGVRYKRWVEIDTGRMGYTILDKPLTSCVILGVKRTVAHENIQKGIMYFTRDCVENVHLESEADKWIYYCNTEEFDTVAKNQLLKQLLYILEKNYIIAIMAVSIIILLIVAYTGYNVYHMQGTISYIVQEAAKNGANTDISTK